MNKNIGGEKKRKIISDIEVVTGRTANELKYVIKREIRKIEDGDGKIISISTTYAESTI